MVGVKVNGSWNKHTLISNELWWNVWEGVTVTYRRPRMGANPEAWGQVSLIIFLTSSSLIPICLRSPQNVWSIFIAWNKAQIIFLYFLLIQPVSPLLPQVITFGKPLAFCLRTEKTSLQYPFFSYTLTLTELVCSGSPNSREVNTKDELFYSQSSVSWKKYSKVKETNPQIHKIREC